MVRNVTIKFFIDFIRQTLLYEVKESPFYDH